MSFLKRIEKVVSTPKSRVLNYLLDHPDEEVNTYQIWNTKTLGITRPTVSRIVRGLEADNIITMTDTEGRAFLFKLNKDNDIVKSLLAMEEKI